jgi:hypothetical protein
MICTKIQDIQPKTHTERTIKRFDAYIGYIGLYFKYFLYEDFYAFNEITVINYDDSNKHYAECIKPNHFL